MEDNKNEFDDLGMPEMEGSPACISFEEALRFVEDPAELLDKLRDDMDPAEILERKEQAAEDRARIEKHIDDRFSGRRKAAMRWRFGLDGDGIHTLCETGEKFGFTYSELRALEARMRPQGRHVRSRLRDYLDD